MHALPGPLRPLGWGGTHPQSHSNETERSLRSRLLPPLITPGVRSIRTRRIRRAAPSTAIAPLNMKSRWRPSTPTGTVRRDESAHRQFTRGFGTRTRRIMWLAAAAHRQRTGADIGSSRDRRIRQVNRARCARARASPTRAVTGAWLHGACCCASCCTSRSDRCLDALCAHARGPGVDSALSGRQ